MYQKIEQNISKYQIYQKLSNETLNEMLIRFGGKKNYETEKY